MERIEIGPVPCEEECMQLGTAEYDPLKAQQECRIYIRQLRRQFGAEPEGARLRVTSNSHDFGTYYEVAVVYDPNNEEACDYAFRLEGESPAHWDAEAAEEISALHRR